MSGNRRKNTPQNPMVSAQDSDSAHSVMTPKTPENLAARTAPTKPQKAERIGEILRNARLQRGDDIYYIAEYLRIKPAFLVALENSQYDQFPADAYVVGFLRSYAALLGLEGKEAVDRYRYEMAGRRKKPVLAMPVAMTEGRAPSALILVGATIAVLLIYALWYGISSSNRTEVTTAPALPTVQQPVSTNTAPATPDAASAAAGLTAPVTNAAPVNAPVPASAAPAPAMPQAAPGIMLTGAVPAPTMATADGTSAKDTAKALSADSAPPASDDKPAKDSKTQVYGDPKEASAIVIRALQSSWIMVTDADGKAVFDHVLKPGDVYKVPNKPGLSLTTGNGSGIVLSLNGTDLPKIASGAPHVVRNIPLDPDRLTTEPTAQ